MSNMFRAWIRQVVSYPKAVLGIIGFLLLIAIAGLPRFVLDASSDSLTLRSDNAWQLYREMIKTYNSGDFLVVTYKPKGDLFSDAALGHLSRMRDELSQVDGVESINSILNVPLLYSPKRSIIKTVSNTRTLETPGVDRAMAKDEFLNSPVYKNLILGSDGQTTAMQLNLAVDLKYIALVQKRDALRDKKAQGDISASESIELDEISAEFLAYRTASAQRSHERVKRIRNITDQYKEDAQIFIGGVSMITADMIRFIQSDLIVFGSAVLLFMVILLAIIFRQLRFVIIPMLSCLVTAVLMLGFISWLDWRLTVISSNFVALLLIISLAIIIHLIVRYREYEQEHPEWDRKQLVEETLVFMSKPCLYAVLTTVVAFMSLVVSDIKPVIDFGWMMSIGLVVALVISFSLLPACLMLTKPRHEKSSSTSGKKFAIPTLAFSSLVEKQGGVVITASIGLVIFCIYGISQLSVENRFIDYFHKDTEIHKGLSVIDNELGGTTTLSILVNADTKTVIVEENADDFGAEFSNDFDDSFDSDFSDGGESEAGDSFSDAFDETFSKDVSGGVQSEIQKKQGKAPDNYWMTVAGLRKLEKVHDFLEAQPEIGNVRSLATLYKVGSDIAGGLNDFELALLQKSLPDELRNAMLSPYWSPEKNQARIAMRVKDLYPNLQRAKLVERIQGDLFSQNLVSSEQAKVTGLLVLYNNLLQSLFSSQIQSLGAVFFGILVMFIILFRSISLSIAAIIPNMLAAVLVLATMGAVGLPLDMMTIVVASVAIGIGVDDTIHYIHRYKEEFAVDRNYVAAMHRSHASIGRAMSYTTVIIVFGFSIMLLSKFIPTIYFGVLTAYAMFVALAGALLLLPKLILMVKPFGPEAS